MTKMFEPVIFFGSGPVAAASLRLLAKTFEVEAVVTKPRAEHHKGDVPVLALAEELNLPTYTTTDKKSLDELFARPTFKSRLGVLIDFGIIVSQKVIDVFPLGIVNSHFSILPEWRGADPITFAVLSGQKLTGVSLMLLVAAMDEGPLLSYGEQPLDGTETTPELTEQLISLSDALLQDQLPRYIEGGETVPQTITGRQVSYSRKLTKEDSILDFTKPAEQLEREVRAFIEWPKSRTTLAGKEVIVTKARVASRSAESGVRSEKKPGAVFVTPEKELAIQTSKDLLIIDRLKPAGKPDMSAQAFLAGHKV